MFGDLNACENYFVRLNLEESYEKRVHKDYQRKHFHYVNERVGSIINLKQSN